MFSRLHLHTLQVRLFIIFWANCSRLFSLKSIGKTVRMYDDWCPMSDVQCLMSNVSWLICKCKCKCKCRDWEDKHTCPLYIAFCSGLGHQHTKGADGSRYQSIYEPTEPSQPMMSEDRWCLMSDVSFQMSDVRRQFSDFRYLMSNVWCLMTDVQYVVSDVQCLMFDFCCLMSDVRCLMTDMTRTSEMRHRWHQTSDIEHRTSNIKHPTSDIGHQI